MLRPVVHLGAIQRWATSRLGRVQAADLRVCRSAGLEARVRGGAEVRPAAGVRRGASGRGRAPGFGVGTTVESLVDAQSPVDLLLRERPVAARGCDHQVTDKLDLAAEVGVGEIRVRRGETRVGHPSKCTSLRSGEGRYPPFPYGLFTRTESRVPGRGSFPQTPIAEAARRSRSPTRSRRCPADAAGGASAPARIMVSCPAEASPASQTPSRRGAPVPRSTSMPVP